MSTLDKYILEVGKHLPRKNRLDLQTEIRSTLEDMLEDRAQQTGRPVDEALIADVLKEYGAPAKVAAAYQTTRYLIGPRMYSLFIMVLQIVLIVLFAVMLGTFILSSYRSGFTGQEFIASLGKVGLDFLMGAIAAFGNIVIVFAILERVLPATEFEAEAEKWDPADLNAEPDPDQISRRELIFEIIFTVLALALFNLYPNWIGFVMKADSTWIYIPSLSDAFFSYLPWINLLWVLDIALDLYLLRKGVWQTVTRLVKLAIIVAEIMLAVVMLTGPSLVAIDAATLANTPVAASADVLASLLNLAPMIVLVIVIIVQTIEAAQIIIGLVKQRAAAKPFMPKR
jgi:hypothetical protein